MNEDELTLEEKFAIANRDPQSRKAIAPDKGDGPKVRDPKDKDKKKKDRTIKTQRVLVRNPDGTIGVEIVDMKTGREVSRPFADNKKEISAGDYSYLFDKKKKKKDSDPQTAPTEEDTPKDPFDGGSSPGRSQVNSKVSGISSTPNAPTSGFTTPAPSSIASQPEEQGDMSDTRGGWIDLTTSAPNETKSNAVPTSLDKEGFAYTDGNNTHPLEGKNLNDIQVSGDYNRAWDAAAIDKAARTLAGEIDLSQTDLSTPEGIAEARGILSTIENRDIANGPNKDVIDTISAPKAYSTWNNDEYAGVANANFEKNPDLYKSIVEGYLEDPTARQNFTNYLNEDVVNPGPSHWVNNLEDKEQIGPHTFGVDTSISSKIPTQSLSDEQKNSVSTDIVNQNFQQGFAYPAGLDIAQSPPQIDLTGVNDMATGIQAQRDYVTPESVQQIKEDLNVSGPLSTNPTIDPTATINNQIAMDNGYSIQQGNQISGTVPSEYSTTQVATRSLPTITGVEDGFTTAPSISQESFDSRFTGTPSITQEDFDSRFNGNVPSITQNDFDSRFSAPTGFADNMGFGDYVNTTDTVGLNDFGQDVAEARINDQVTIDNAPTISAGMSIASTAPTVAAETNAVDSLGIDASTATSAGEGFSSSDGTGMSTNSSVGEGPGFSGASSSGVSGESTTSDTTGSSGFGGFGGMFGGTDTDVESESDGFL